MRFSSSIKPKMKVGRTEALLNDQGYTYNQAGFSYNQAGVTYGGIYQHDIVQSKGQAKDIR